MFPSFNLYSSSLLFLTLQGLILAILLFFKYKRTDDKYNAWMSLLLATTCYHQTVYILGFLGWYDTYETTKINYFYTDLRLIIGPLLFFMIRSIYEPNRAFIRKDLWHFLPIAIYIAFKIFIGVYDANQPGFSEVQNGPMTINFQWKILDPLAILISVIQTAIYLVLCFQMLSKYRNKVAQYFSDVKLEFNWILIFLISYSFLFGYSVLQEFVNTVITKVSYTQAWWYYVFSGIIVIYLGIKGYYSSIAELKSQEVALFIQEEPTEAKDESNNLISEQYVDRLSDLEKFMKEEKPFLEPTLTLVELSRKLRMSREELSEIINKGAQKRFNDYINEYRIDEFKNLVQKGAHNTMSLYGVALDCGFNSKATFNRVFKKIVSKSPTDYIKSIDNQ